MKPRGFFTGLRNFPFSERDTSAALSFEKKESLLPLLGAAPDLFRQKAKRDSGFLRGPRAFEADTDILLKGTN
jgi:hypothetical protein